MSNKKVIAVAGATGVLGGGAARAILVEPESGSTVRALTRDPDSPAARVLAATGLRHVVWSTLEDSRMSVLQGKCNVPHFDVKGEGNELFSQAGVPTTFLGPQRGEDGVLTLNLPLEDGKLLSGVDVADIGRTVGLAGDHLTGARYAEKLAAALGEPVRFQSVPYDVPSRFRWPRSSATCSSSTATSTVSSLGATLR
ncbi:NmrA family NAD(P)-binding protein [Streptomyces sp. NPDC021056]|uniref:NmrA family NAD(P)-binding protein n=1 Tax=Streptomyces sp. NPDC021056 TaxID=3155012 RepID=UPI0033D1EA17